MRRPIGVFLLVAFFDIAALIVLFVGVALTWPGTPVDIVWELYPARRAELMPHAAWMGPMFLGLFAVFSAASMAFCFCGGGAGISPSRSSARI